MKFLQKKWPFAVNALLLVLMVILGLYLFNDVLGFTGVFQACFGYAEEAWQGREIPQVDWDWQIGMLGGVFIGGLCGALIHGSWKLVWGFEESKKIAGKSLGTALSGMASGFLVMLGAIMSGEAFYGQIAAAMEISAGAWLFLVTALTSGGITALFLERREKTGGADNDGGEK